MLLLIWKKYKKQHCSNVAKLLLIQEKSDEIEFYEGTYLFTRIQGVSVKDFRA
jgi:hypothetical protein